MILPEGNSKKYIKVVIGIYVLFTIVSPIITKISGKEIQVSDIIDLDEYIEEAKTASKAQNQMEIQNEDNILDIYINGIKEDMKAKIEAKGYVVNNITINVANDGSYEIQNAILDVEKRASYSTENTKTKSTEQKVANTEKTENAENAGNVEDTENAGNAGNTGNTESIETIEAINKVDVNISMSNTENTNSNNKDSDNNDEGNNQNELSIMQKQELKEYISSVYEIKENNITIIQRSALREGSSATNMSCLALDTDSSTTNMLRLALDTDSSATNSRV